MVDSHQEQDPEIYKKVVFTRNLVVEFLRNNKIDSYLSSLTITELFMSVLAEIDSEHERKIFVSNILDTVKKADTNK